MLTKTDFINLRREFVTRKEFRYEIVRLENEIKEFRQQFTEFKDSVLKTLDWLVGAFKNFRGELQILTSRYPEVLDKLDNHEIRITKLEKKTN